MEYLVIYKHSNDEELATIKCLLTLRKQPYITFEDLVSKYAEEFDIDIDQIENNAAKLHQLFVYNDINYSDVDSIEKLLFICALANKNHLFISFNYHFDKS